MTQVKGQKQIMNYTTILKIIAGVTTLVVLFKTGFIETMMIFLLVGAIPGTSANVSSQAMLVITLGILWIVLLRLTVLKKIHAFVTKQLVRMHDAVIRRFDPTNQSA